MLRDLGGAGLGVSVAAGVGGLAPSAAHATPLPARPAASAGDATGSPSDAARPVTVGWQRTLRRSTTHTTLQVVVNPLLRPGQAVRGPALRALRSLGADYVRYVPWYPYPRLGVAELEAPTDQGTSWDFSLIDPLTTDFLDATAGHPVIVNFSTIPDWMFVTDTTTPVPADPDTPDWDYNQGTRFRDPTLKEVGDYYARLVSWYTRGGFTDEHGRYHHSGHHFRIDYWEVLNEVDFEHQMSPEQYTAVYDAIVTAIRTVVPDMKFVGLALGGDGLDYVEYFLDRDHHQPGVPLDMISYHFYAEPADGDTVRTMPPRCFAQADAFLTKVEDIEAVRKRLSPTTRTTIDEIGTILPSAATQPDPAPIPDFYWNLSGGIYAYVFARLATLGIDVAGESQLVGGPGQYPSVALVDWTTGAPNARFRVLELLHRSFAPGDVLVPTTAGADFHAQGFRTRAGLRRLLLVSKSPDDLDVELSGFRGGTARVVDQVTAGGPARTERLTGDTFRLPALGVAVLTQPRA